MKLSTQRTGRFLIAAVLAGAIGLPGCGEGPAPKPATKPAPPPPQAAAKPAPEPPAAATPQAESDRALAAKVKSALGAEPRLNAHRVDVVARDGAVTLFGTTESREQQEMAAKLAAAVAGVKSVENKLAIVAGS